MTVQCKAVHVHMYAPRVLHFCAFTLCRTLLSIFQTYREVSSLQESPESVPYACVFFSNCSVKL